MVGMNLENIGYIHMSNNGYYGHAFMAYETMAKYMEVGVSYCTKLDNVMRRELGWD